VLAAPVAAVGLPPASATPSATRVRVQLVEFKVLASVSTVRAGKVTFVVRNAGRLPHMFVVIKTNLAPGAVPVKGARASEQGKVGAIPVFAPGKTRTLTLTLKPGKYVLICNVPGHYLAGQRTGFRVT
jgi:uncharacterized cupredoxin-like copper-binding protein